MHCVKGPPPAVDLGLGAKANVVVAQLGLLVSACYAPKNALQCTGRGATTITVDNRPQKKNCDPTSNVPRDTHGVLISLGNGLANPLGSKLPWVLLSRNYPVTESVGIDLGSSDDYALCAAHLGGGVCRKGVPSKFRGPKFPRMSDRRVALYKTQQDQEVAAHSHAFDLNSMILSPQFAEPS
ncbi:hypothetical protein EDB87DRAFT_1574396 [Lactarius vividus]|nr:hypothetical protein EDB87DRAFT_1574396 [Lactarius vividus]